MIAKREKKYKTYVTFIGFSNAGDGTKNMENILCRDCNNNNNVLFPCYTHTFHIKCHCNICLLYLYLYNVQHNMFMCVVGPLVHPNKQISF